MKSVIEKRQEAKQRKEEAIKGKDADKRKQIEMLEYMKKTTAHSSPNSSLERLSDKELQVKLGELKKWESIDLKQVTAQTEIVFLDQHFCNNNLKVRNDT